MEYRNNCFLVSVIGKCNKYGQTPELSAERPVAVFADDVDAQQYAEKLFAHIGGTDGQWWGNTLVYKPFYGTGYSCIHIYQLPYNSMILGV